MTPTLEEKNLSAVAAVYRMMEGIRKALRSV
jgi:hypothetical protein